MSHNIALNNRFELFVDEEDDPADLLLKQQQQQADKARADKDKPKRPVVVKEDAKKAAAAGTKSQVTATRPQQAAVKPAATQNAPRKPPMSDASQKAAPRQNVAAASRPVRPAVSNDVDGASAQRPAQRQENTFRDRPEGEGLTSTNDFRAPSGVRRGRGQGRGTGGSSGSTDSGFDRFGKREFERRSGSDKTGLKPVEKRSGGGAHNWGNINDTLDAQLKTAEELVEQTEIQATARGNRESVEDAAGAAGVEEETDEKQMTLEEWKTLQEQQRKKATFNIRKAGEGCSTDPDWKKMQVLNKKKESTAEQTTEDEQFEDSEKDGAKAKNVIPIAITFSGDRDNEQRGGRRGGRGGPGGRGGAGRGAAGGRGQAAASDQAPDVASEQDFPSLG